MYQFWNVERFRDNHPNNYDDLGTQYIQLIIRNIDIILDHFNNERFLNTLAPLAEIYAPSYLYQAQLLADNLELLQEFLSRFIVEKDDQTIAMNQKFDQINKQISAQHLLEIVNSALGTISNWNQFRNQSMDMNMFRDKVDTLRNNFQLQINQNCNCPCQLI
ncbi:unnamed protein product [Paramecium sonneborni]|uniref:Uncharacterized protein n=1 Tax=Paramecium sonneborni TaxID=65129 RepID=A0A8S1MIY5_9CILI|nr:unnamed protein product [Paramecium sonneborni]